ncbi:HutD/Ves family protein [Hydrocarboniphaga sp.]|uniref:HutD/Ves family protein n=1 Tax=Hydrocarboniphaga sp. TaxID=2033016 RepID=UPI003D0D38CF
MTATRDGVEVLRAAAHRRMRWKNGGGETLEIAVSPADATLDTMDWRISMAVVAQHGPFSLFAGIDRTLCILDGAGMELDFGSGDVRTVTIDSAPLSFAADVALQARLLNGPITDLNVMTRRDTYRHRVHRLPLGAQPSEFTLKSPLLLLLCGNGGVRCDIDGAQWQLDARDALLLREPGPTPLRLSAASADAMIYQVFLEAK